jgi:uncharacterized Zn-finger protein
LSTQKQNKNEIFIDFIQSPMNTTKRKRDQSYNITVKKSPSRNSTLETQTVIENEELNNNNNNECVDEQNDENSTSSQSSSSGSSSVTYESNASLNKNDTNSSTIAIEKPTTRRITSFSCDVCKVGFNQKIHLIKHSAKHTGIKPFKCSECPYSTVERSHLKVHVRVHTGEKPFKCSFCEYSTAQSSTLKIHKKRHHHKIKLEKEEFNETAPPGDTQQTANSPIIEPQETSNQYNNDNCSATVSHNKVFFSPNKTKNKLLGLANIALEKQDT